MVNFCNEVGLEVSQNDLISSLEEITPNSIGAISGLHIVEHLALSELILMIDLSLRALVPGGLVIFETPNPENIVTATCNFYYDPTHRNPLPPPLLKFLFENRGFCNIEIKRLNPSQFIREPSEDLPKELINIFNNPQDYAVIGRKA
jgi:O-antigen chain-terminating methyltransferase